MRTHHAPPALPPLTFEQATLLLQHLLGDGATPQGKRLAIGITTTEGQHLSIDSSSSPMVTAARHPAPALSIITNERTLSAVLTGAMDPDRPEPEYLFVFGGDVEQWRALIGAVSAVTPLGVRLSGPTRSGERR